MFPVVENVGGNLLITGDLVVSEMELPFILRLDNVRAIETMLYDPEGRRYVAINQEKLTGSELAQALQAYIEEYNSPLKGRLTRETMLPGDLLYDTDTGSFVMRLAFDSEIRFTITDDTVYLTLQCTNPSAEALVHSTEVFVHLTASARHVNDIE